MSDVLRRESLSKRFPCWVCSKPLAFDGTFYIAAIRFLDGHERRTHLCCTGEARQFPTDLPGGDRSGRRVKPSPRLDEIEERLVGGGR